MSLAGFDFQHLNKRFLTAFNQPVNLAAQYGVSIIQAQAATAWRCIGVYHLPPQENNGRHNVFVEVLNEDGYRTALPRIAWTWWMDAPTQYVKLDKPANEPACDIPISRGATVTLRVDGLGIPSDSVGNLRATHPDEAVGNTMGHHSFYVVFQLQRSAVVTPPVEPEKPQSLTLEQRVERNEDEIRKLWAIVNTWNGGK